MKKITIIVFCVLYFLPTIFAQKKKQLSYFDGKKTVLLEYNTDYIFISGTNEQDLRTVHVGQLNIDKKALKLRNDHISKIVVQPENFILKHPNRIWTKLSIKDQKITVSQYLKLLTEIRQDNPSLIVAPYVETSNNEVIGLTNYVLVKLKSKQDFEVLMNQANQLNLDLIGYHQYMPLWFTFSVRPTGMNILEATNRLHNTNLFEYVEPDLRFNLRQNSASKVSKTNLVPNDPFYGDQWHLSNTGQNGGIAGMDINAEAAWDIETGDPNIITAVIDDGFERNHPDLIGNNANPGFDATGAGGASVVYTPHGTSCAGIVAADGNNNVGVTGVAYTSSLMSVSFDYAGVTFQIAATAFNLAANNGASIISNSWGADSIANSPILNEAITNALENGRDGLGCVVVFAAGNEDTAVGYPANSNPDILAVGAMSPCGERKSPTSCDGEALWGSNFGNQLDLVAPGVLIPTTDRQGDVPDDPFPCFFADRIVNDYNADACINNFYPNLDYFSRFNGTSSACPMVAGVAALILSVNPGLTNIEVNDIIESTTREVRTDLYNYTKDANRPNGNWNNQMGYGLLDAFAAVQAADACPQDLILSGTETSTISHQAENSITSTQTIEPTADVDYLAGNSITMLPGFFGKDGCVFETTIGVACKTSKQEGNNSTLNSDHPMYSMQAPLRDITNKEVSAEVGLTVIPNPFQTTAKIVFHLEQETEINLAVFDLTGRKVKQLAEGSLGIGTHEIKWETEGQPPGVYLAKLVNGDKIQTAKMILAK